MSTFINVFILFSLTKYLQKDISHISSVVWLSCRMIVNIQNFATLLHYDTGHSVLFHRTFSYVGFFQPTSEENLGQILLLLLLWSHSKLKNKKHIQCVAYNEYNCISVLLDEVQNFVSWLRRKGHESHHSNLNLWTSD